MKKFFKVMLVVGFMTATSVYSQVGIPTNNPNKDAVLDLNRTDGTSTKGLLLPKVELTATNSPLPMTANVAGMHVWNTATSVAGVNAVSPGEYFNDGTKWVRVSSSDDAWLQDGNNNGLIKAIGTNDAFDLPIETNGTEKMRVTTTGNVGIGTSTPNAKLDIRPSPTSTTNPGVAFLGIGTTNVVAPSAGAGAIRYSTNSGGSLEFSNGVVWNQLTSTVKRSVVVAKKITTQSYLNSVATNVVDWVVEIDNNSNFASSTGIFTAPRNGQYIVSFSYCFDLSSYNAGTVVEAQLWINGVQSKKNLLGFPSAGSSLAGCSITFTLVLNAGDKVNPVIYQNSGSTKVLSTTSLGFTNFSIAEL